MLPDDLKSITAHIATGLHERTRDQVIFPQDRRAQFSRTASENPPFHEVVASELIRQIEAGTAPWQKPWNADGGIGGMPINPTTGKRYKGINAIHLLAQGHADPRWLTYKQAASLDAQVRKGERGTSIQYWKFEDTRTKTDDLGRPILEPDGTPVQERYKLDNPKVFYATVFNAEQIDGLAPLLKPELKWDPVERAEQILTNSGAQIQHAAVDRAYYSPARDEIHLPLQAQFPTAGAYYATALHELGHWTGHESRLQRDLNHAFGSEGYAREELRAEIASMMLCAELGLPHDPSQHASYVASWVSVLKQDPLEIFRAAADAEKINALALSYAPAQAQELNLSESIATSAPTPNLSPAPMVQPESAAAIDPAPTSAPATHKANSMQFQPLSADDVRDALSYISPNLARDDWARIGMALKSEFPNDIGLDLFDQWSASGEGYVRNAVLSTWRSIRAEGAVKIGTLLKLAQENGFKPRQDSAWRAPVAPTMDAATQAAKAAAAAQEQQERLSQQQSAASQAMQMWQNAQPEGEAAYLQRKGVGAHGTRTSANGILLVPLVDEQGTLWNVQRILPQKLNNGTDKLFLKGGRKSGLFHVIGDMGSNAQQPILFAEGYATAASLHEATGWPTVVCLDAGNLVKVAKQFRRQNPQALIVVAGDDDLQTLTQKGVNPGRDKATLAAQQASGALAFPQRLAPQSSDFNDLVAQYGQEAGHSLIRASLHVGLTQYAEGAQPWVELSEGQIRQAQDALGSLERQGLVSVASNLTPNRAPETTVEPTDASPQAQTFDAPRPGAVEQPPLQASEPPQDLSTTVSVPAAPLGEGILAISKPNPASQNPETTNPAGIPPEQFGPASVTPSAVPGSADALSVVAPVVPPAAAVAPAPRPDPINDLNLQALQAKRARDAQQVQQEMGHGAQPQNQAGDTAVEPGPLPGMNSVSGTAPVQETGQDTHPYQELRALRERLSKEFQYDGAGKYYYRQGKQELAFEDKGGKFDTPHHSPEIAAAIAQLAHAKGWKQMHLSGTPEFRREMWLQASLMGLKVIGYEPQAIDHVRLAERRQLLAKDQPPQAASKTTINSVAATLAPNPEVGSASTMPTPTTFPPTPSAPTVKATPAPALLSGAAAKQLDAQLRAVLTQNGANEPQAIEMTLGKLYSQVQSPRVYLGQLLEHGAAPYKFDPKEQDSYFIKLQSKSGVQTVWGVDLPRALNEMSANGESAIGQDILLTFQGLKKVQALLPQKDASGLPAGEQWELVDRNTWFVQPVMQAYAQSQHELAQMPPEIPADSFPSADANPTVTADAASAATPEATAQTARPAPPAQAMKAAPPPSDRLRHALAQLKVDPLQAEITLASMQSLFASPKFQVGRLLEHGEAPLRFTQGQPLSYYMKLATEQGHVLLWSADFPRAMNNNPVHHGQTVVVAYRGIEVVGDGQNQAQPRNDWLIAPLEQLHADAQQGVVQRMSNAKVMPASPAPRPSASQEQQSLYILREAMRQAGIPQEFALPTLKEAQRRLGSGPDTTPTSLGQPGLEAAQTMATRPSPKSPQLSATPSVSRKVGPSI
ncbi:zincin-like metallopeptidase domain-containing protein [Limnohabitans radicicola]|uniref:zincin-like metallopeptidase domain-containing protein n=1 Tax=Limnohabitans radicicola TaxID=2771427 RepID=UPI001CD86039|nr:zincin-like metallopeptidase domain-containing protein [Limnohabitans radicicola]